MKTYFIERFGRLSENDIDELETQLTSVLKPVIPRQEFVSGLRAGLFNREIKTDTFPLVSGRISKGLLVVGGVVASLVMLITSIRGLVSLFGLIGLISRRFSKNAPGTQSGQTTLA